MSLLMEYRKYIKDSQELNTEFSRLKDKVNALSFEDLEQMDYETLKELKPLISVSNKNNSDFSRVYERKRLEKYPFLMGPVYFEEIKELDMLCLDEKKRLDTLLSKYKKGNLLLLTSPIISKNSDLFTKAVLNKLCKLGVLERMYVYKPLCDCSDEFKTIEVISEEQFKKLEYWLRLDKSKLSSSEYEKLDREYNIILDIQCENYDCDNPEGSFEVETIDDLYRYTTIQYRLLKNPNRETETL